MTSKHQTERIQRKYERLLKRCPTWLEIDYSLVNNLADLQFQLEHELDLYEDGEGSIKTRAQAHRIKMLRASAAEVRAEEAAR